MTIPNISATQNGTAFNKMQAQMKKMIAEAADSAAAEIGKLLTQATKVLKADLKHAETVVPEFNDTYVQCVVLAATFRALRDEYATAYMRVEAAQQDKHVCRERVAGASEAQPLGSCRTDTEFASVTRSLEYYDTLDQRLEEIDSGLKKTVIAHTVLCQQQRAEDDARQEDIPAAERKYVSMPQLRWIKSEDRTADPKGCNEADDVKAAHRQAERFIEWNWNRA